MSDMRGIDAKLPMPVVQPLRGRNSVGGQVSQGALAALAALGWVVKRFQRTLTAVFAIVYLRLSHPTDIGNRAMQSKATTVAQYLAELPEDRRAALQAVRKVILRNLDSGFEEGMQYGMIGYYVPHRLYPAGYHCDPRQPLPFAALASQKNYMSLYMMSEYGDERAGAFQRAWAKTGKKLDMGKCCIRFKKLEDLALDVIGDTLRKATAKKFIAFYETAIKGSRKKAAASGKPAKKAKSAKKPKVKPSTAKRPASKPRGK